MLLLLSSKQYVDEVHALMEDDKVAAMKIPEAEHVTMVCI